MNVNIFVGGNIESYNNLNIDKSNLNLCADSGVVHSLNLNIAPDVVIGDFDSYNDKNSLTCKIIECQPEKDDTDTLMCVKYALKLGVEKIFIYGGLSGRFDHSFANIQTLKFCMNNGVYAEICDGFNKATLQSNGIKRYYKDGYKYFSIFSLTQKLDVKILSGTKYTLENYTLTSDFPLGVSNEIIDDFATLDIKKGTALIIFSEK